MILTGEKESFIVRVLLKKIKDAGVECTFVPFDVNSINPAFNDNTSLVVLFMEDGYQPPKDVLHYLKDQLEEKDISVEKALVQHEGLIIAGSGGGSKFTGTTPFERSDEELFSDFSLITEQGEEALDNLVAIMHNPPKDTECDMIPGGIHVGSEKLRAYIEKRTPFLVVTGHIHESAGIDKIGETTVIGNNVKI